MRKLLILITVLFAIASYAEETEKKEWEIKPGIISGGYSDATGPYIFKFYQAVSSPSSLPYCDYDAYINYNWSINIGYGEYEIHTEEITTGQVYYKGVFEDDLGKYLFFQYNRGWSWKALPEGYSDPWPTTGSYTYHVYKKEFIQPMSISFSSESYTAPAKRNFSVRVMVIGGSGYYTGTTVKPAFLTTVGFLTYSGMSYTTGQTSISVVVKDKVTGQECSASADITITEESNESDDNPSNPSNPSDPSDPSDPSNPSNPSDPSDPTEPADPSNPDSPSDPTEPDNPDEPDPDDVPEEPAEPEVPDVPSEPENPSNPDTPDSPDVPAEPDNPDEPIIVLDPVIPDEPVVVPDNPDSPDEPENSEPSDISDESDEVIIIDPTSPGNEDDEPTIIVVDRESSDSDKIIVTDDGVTTVRPDNYDLAIFLGMFGAFTALSGNATAPVNEPMQVQQAQQESSPDKINYVE